MSKVLSLPRVVVSILAAVVRGGVGEPVDVEVRDVAYDDILVLVDVVRHVALKSETASGDIQYRMNFHTAFHGHVLPPHAATFGGLREARTSGGNLRPEI